MNITDIFAELIKLNPDMKENWSGFLQQRNSSSESVHPHDFLFLSDYTNSIRNLEDFRQLSDLLESVFTNGDDHIKTQVTITLLGKLLDFGYILENEILKIGQRQKNRSQNW